MPLPLSHDELAMLHALAAPIDASRRPEFHAGCDDEARGRRPRCDRARRSASDGAHGAARFLEPAAGPSPGGSGLEGLGASGEREHKTD